MINNEIDIYSNFKNYDFFNQLIPNYSLNFKEIDNLKNENNNPKPGIIFFDNSLNKSDLNLNSISKKYLLVTNIKNKTILNSNNFIFIQIPISPSKIKVFIKNYLLSMSNQYEDIIVMDSTLINFKKNLSCSITHIENEILVYLINEKNCSKDYVKKNILHIKPSLETNSLESHLTRIRKKLEKVNTKIKIQSKNDILLISSN